MSKLTASGLIFNAYPSFTTEEQNPVFESLLLLKKKKKLLIFMHIFNVCSVLTACFHYNKLAFQKQMPVRNKGLKRGKEYKIHCTETL